VRRWEITPLELVDAAIARIEAAADLNAVLMPTFELARATAQTPLAAGPLAVFRFS
jgi:amidase